MLTHLKFSYLLLHQTCRHQEKDGMVDEVSNEIKNYVEIQFEVILNILLLKMARQTENHKTCYFHSVSHIFILNGGNFCFLFLSLWYSENTVLYRYFYRYRWIMIDCEWTVEIDDTVDTLWWTASGLCRSAQNAPKRHARLHMPPTWWLQIVLPHRPDWRNTSLCYRQYTPRGEIDFSPDQTIILVTFFSSCKDDGVICYSTKKKGRGGVILP